MNEKEISFLIGGLFDADDNVVKFVMCEKNSTSICLFEVDCDVVMFLMGANI